VLVDMLGYPVADAAAVLGVSTGTIKSRCARGRARLVPRLAHLRGQPQPDGAAPPPRVPAPPESSPPPGAVPPAGAVPPSEAIPGGEAALAADTGPPPSDAEAAMRNPAPPGYVSPAERGGDSRP
jgi:RNA polymerase sigma-70 factor (ECF subfamily)